MPRKNTIADFHAKIDSSDSGCWPVDSAPDKDGYGRFWLDGKHWKAHQLAYVLANGPITDGLFVCHSCDNPICCRPDHLFLGTAADNQADCVAKGRTARGNKNGSRLHPELLKRGDNHPNHLRPETRPRGDQHGLRLHPERAPMGERNGNGKLTESDVRQVRQMLAQGIGISPIAQHFSVTYQNIRSIHLGKTWRHLIT